MGACYSCHPVPPHCSRLKGSSLGALCSGDVVLLLDGSKDSPYLFKGGPSAGWARACISGFLVHEDSSPGGLILYHADKKTSDGTCRQVVGIPLEDALLSGHYSKAIVRRLHRPLSPSKVTLVQEFAHLNVGRVSPAESPASVLMANTSSTASVATAYERMGCSEFVAMMLHLIGVVEPTDIQREFLAITPKGRVFGPPHPLRLALSHNSHSNSGSDDVSPSPRSPASVTGGHTPQCISPRTVVDHPFGPSVSSRASPNAVL